MPVRVRSSTLSSVASLGFAGKQRLDQLQIANRGGVEHQRIGAVVEGGALQMIERGALRVAQIVKNRRGRAGGERPMLQPAAV